jgi:hypothetical protein
MSELGTWIEENGKYSSSTEDAIRFGTLFSAFRIFGKTVKDAIKEADEFNMAVESTLPKKLSWIQKIRGYDELAHDLEMEIDNSNWLKENRIKVLENQVEMFSALATTNKRNATRFESALSEALRDRDLHARVADNWQAKAKHANDIAEQVLWDNATIGRRLKFSVGHNHVEIIIGNPVTYIENFETTDIKSKISGWSISRCSKKDVYDWKTGVIKSLDNLCDEKKYTQKLRRDLRKALANKYPEIFNESNRV